jgi:DNA-binding transcriptional LysR family regulator
MFIRQIHYLLALAKTGHFGRAAEHCHVSQPALSSAIQHLEEELGVNIVQRGQRFQGITPEGERLLHWARRLADDWEALKQEATRCNQQLTGTLRIGAIPTALAVLPLLTEPLQHDFPGIHVQLLAMSAEEIALRLDRFELDFGLSYLDDPIVKGFKALPLYRETQVLLAREPNAALREAPLRWQDIAELPLCLLTPNMQNRKLIDAALREANVTPKVRIETDSMFTLYAYVRNAGLYSIVPHSLLGVFDTQREISAIPLHPLLTRQIGLIARRQDPPPPLQEAVWTLTRHIDLQQRFDPLISNAD